MGLNCLGSVLIPPKAGYPSDCYVKQEQALNPTCNWFAISLRTSRYIKPPMPHAILEEALQRPLNKALRYLWNYIRKPYVPRHTHTVIPACAYAYIPTPKDMYILGRRCPWALGEGTCRLQPPADSSPSILQLSS